MPHPLLITPGLTWTGLEVGGPWIEAFRMKRQALLPSCRVRSRAAIREAHNNTLGTHLRRAWEASPGPAFIFLAHPVPWLARTVQIFVVPTPSTMFVTRFKAATLGKRLGVYNIKN